MKVRMLQDVDLLGTNLKLYEGEVYNAEYATNQPHWQLKGQVFVEASAGGESVLCTLDDECTIAPANGLGSHYVSRLKAWLRQVANESGISLAGVQHIGISRGLYGADLITLSGPAVEYRFHVDLDGAELVGSEYMAELESYQLAADAGMLPGGRHG